MGEPDLRGDGGIQRAVIECLSGIGRHAKVIPVDLDADVAQLGEREKLWCRVGGMCDISAGQDGYLADLALVQGFEYVRGDIGSAQFVGSECQDARHIQCDIAVPDDHRMVNRQVDGDVCLIWVPVVPGHDLACG
ncbi:Uncharacterised protein [Mycobacteroides abscessus subsp. abscessus]|nr:Uncharacterised protein [Mycobacteroides abscessus subsp. abscessus]